MNVVIATPNVFEASSPFNHLFQDILGGFLEAGYHVTRLVAVEDEQKTDFKYGFEGKNITYKLYKRKKSPHNNIFSRYVRDVITSLRQAKGILSLKDGDVLFEDVSYSSVWPVTAAKVKKMKVILMLQDIWPDNAVQTNLIRDRSILYHFFEFFQRYTYKKADKIICISDDMKAFIESKGIPSQKIEVIYNWGYSDEAVDIAWEDNLFVEKYHLSKDKFYAVYAGNIGKMQNVQIIVDAANYLKAHSNVHFLIIGDGAMRKQIEMATQDMANVTMLPFQPSELATSIYSMAGVNLIPLVPGGLRTALPSKIGICLSCGNRIIVCADQDSMLATMFRQYQCGKIVSPSNPEMLAKSILSYSYEKEISTEKKHYECFYSIFSRSKNVNRYVQEIRK